MASVFYYIAAGFIRVLQALPLRWVARIGRLGGALAYRLDGRHRRVALQNLTRCLGNERSPEALRSLALENFRRLGENYCSALKTADMTWEELEPHLEFAHLEKLGPGTLEGKPRRVVVAIGHFGNFELYARLGHAAPQYRTATTYRALRQPALNRLLLSLRERSGCLFFERRTDAELLKTELGKGSLILGLLADQHAGERGVSVPFFGQNCSTTPSPALLALRYDCALHTGICYRVGLARWRVEAGDEIPIREGGQARALTAIMTDVTRAFEKAIRRDPANWFWVHNRWKPFRSRYRESGPSSLPPDRTGAESVPSSV